MDKYLKQQFAKGYQKDIKYTGIVKDLREVEKQYQDHVAHAQQYARERNKPFSTKDNALLYRSRLPFVIIDSLLYNIRANSTRTLYIPYNEVLKYILAATYNKKYHFGEKYILYNLQGLSISNKTYIVKLYVKYCPIYQLNVIDRQLLIGNYQLVRPSNMLPIQVIAIDFIVGLPAIKVASTPQQLENKPEYNTLFIVSCKLLKRTLLLPGHSTYSAKDQGRLLLQHLLLSNQGILIAIISNRDYKFTSSLQKGIQKQLGIQLLITIAYYL